MLAIASLATPSPAHAIAASEHLARELSCLLLVAGAAACLVALVALTLAGTLEHSGLLAARRIS